MVFFLVFCGLMIDNSAAQIVRAVSIMTDRPDRLGRESMEVKRPIPDQKPEFRVRKPTQKDGVAVHSLIAQCPPLDPNSVYCNLLQCSHFADTSVLVEIQGEAVAFMSGYLKPTDAQVLFVWQVAVAEAWRGHGLAGRMLDALVQRPELKAVSFLETSVTPSNEASAKLFRRFADKRHAPLITSILFSQAEHFAGRHDDEVLFRIGPFNPQQSPSQ